MLTLASVGGRLDFQNNVALATLDLPALASVGGTLGVNGNAALASIDLRRLVAIGGTVIINSNDDANIVTALPCVAMDDPYLQPVGGETYYSPHPTICHGSDSSAVGNDGACGECAERSESRGERRWGGRVVDEGVDRRIVMTQRCTRTRCQAGRGRDGAAH